MSSARSVPAPPAPPNTREARGLRLAALRFEEIHPVSPDVWSVPSCSGENTYLVRLRHESCNCPDFKRHHQPCKHLYAAHVVKAKTVTCEGCSSRFRHRDLVEVTEENAAFTLSVFVGERYCRSCAGDRGIL